jgi:hypothetical protein
VILFTSSKVTSQVRNIYGPVVRQNLTADEPVSAPFIVPSKKGESRDQVNLGVVFSDLWRGEERSRDQVEGSSEVT